MPPTKDDLEEQITHQKELLRKRRLNLYRLEIQEANYAGSPPINLMNQMDQLIEQVRASETEIARLQTLAVEDKESLEKVEYRMYVAAAWDTLAGRPSVAAATRLEYQRLQLRISLESAKQIELEVRKAIVEEWFRLVHPRFYHSRTYTYTWNIELPLNDKIFSDEFLNALRLTNINNLKVVATIRYPQFYYNKDQQSIDILVKCIYLDYKRILEVYTQNFSKEPLEIIDIQVYDENQEPKEIAIDPKTAFNISELSRYLFYDLRRQLYHSHYATRVNNEAEQIGEFIDKVYQEVCSNLYHSDLSA